ncbi:hypothetical protein V8J88_08575 [Massilia sp. W12]|uniref:hypothetical protein n=1 Tax=Massilia sp. W12 TaxID=3126507 RepID=UPI0030CA795F
MKTALIRGMICVVLAGFAAHAAARPPLPLDSRHPILGSWVLPIEHPRHGECLETYYFRADGTTLVTSAEEVAETVFEISPKPSRAGFYRWSEKLVKDNGKKDCSGKVSRVGSESVSYIRFLEDGERFIVCQEESLRACFGPFYRLQGQSL